MKTIEVSIKESIAYLLRKWWVVALCVILGATVFAISAFGYRPHFPEAQQEIILAKNEEMLLNEAKSQVAAIQKLEKESLLSRLNPMDAEAYSITLFAYSPETVERNQDYNYKNSVSYSALRRYYNLATEASFVQIFRSIPQSYTEQQLRDIVQLRFLEANLVIKVYSIDGIDAKLYADTLVRFLQEKGRQFADLQGEYELKVVNESTYRAYDEQLFLHQKRYFDYLGAVKGAKDRVINSLTAKKALPQVVTNPIESRRAHVIRQTVTGALVGGVLGILAAAALYAVRLTIQLPEQIQKQLKVNYIGGNRKTQSLNSLMALLTGRLRLVPEDTLAVMTAEHLKSIHHGTVLLTGTVKKDVMEQFAAKLRLALEGADITLVVGGSLNEDVEAVKALTTADGVLLLERLNRSHLREVNEQVDRVQVAQKPLLGYVLV